MFEKSPMGMEQVEAQKFDDAERHHTQHEDAVVGANLELDETSLPPGYFRSKFFVGTMAGIGLGLMAGVAAYGYAAPILGIINADIGPVRRIPSFLLPITDHSFRIPTLYGLHFLTPSPQP